MEWTDLVLKGFALLGACTFTYLVVVHGFGWVFTQVSTWVGSWYSVAKADFVALDQRVTVLESYFMSKVSTPAPVKPITPTTLTGITGGHAGL